MRRIIFLSFAFFVFASASRAHHPVASEELAPPIKIDISAIPTHHVKP